MKEQVLEIIENSQIRYRMIDGECNACAWTKDKGVHMCEIVNNTLNSLDKAIDELIK